MIKPIISFDQVEGAMQNARLVMNAYLRAHMGATADGEIRIVLSKRAPRFYYVQDEGKYTPISNVLLKRNEKQYTVIFNGKDEEETPLTDLSSDELYTLCSLVESFWKHIKTEDKTGIEDVECEIVK